MLVPVTDIGPEGLEVDRTVPPSREIETGGQALRPAPARVLGRVQRVGLGYEFRGRIETSVQLPCSRCLEPYRQGLDLPFELVYRQEGEAGRPTADDPGIAFLDEGRIDLAQLVEEQTYLALPLKPLCRADCRGLCPQCGAQWNRESCRCETEASDPRWSALKALKDEMNGTDRRSR